MTRRQRGFTRFTRPAFPGLWPPGWNGPPLGFSAGFTPRRYRRRTPRMGQAVEHGPGTTRSHQLILQSGSSLVSCDLASQRPGQERRSWRPTRSLAGEAARRVMSRLSPPHRAFHRAGVAGHAAPAPPGRAPVCRQSARKRFRLRDTAGSASEKGMTTCLTVSRLRFMRSRTCRTMSRVAALTATHCWAGV